MDVTLGHFSASARADAVVTRRQLLPPKPSVKPSLIFFGPHQDGLPASCFADDVAASVRTAAAASASASSEPLFLLILLCLLSSSGLTVLTGLPGSGGRYARHAPAADAADEGAPVDAVERDADRERARLHERPRRVRHAERQHELVELRQ